MIKRGKSEAISHVFYLDDVVADAGTVTVTVTKDGETIHTGSTTKTGNTYSFTLPAQDDLGTFSILWNGTLLDDTTYDEIIGDYLFELYELDALLVSQGMEQNYSASLKKAVRDQVTETFQSVTNMPPVLRRISVVVPVYGDVAYVSPVGVREVVSVNGDPFTGDYRWDGRIEDLSGTTATIVYEASYTESVTAEARGKALELAVSLMAGQTSSTPVNAESITNDSGTYRLALVGTRGIQVPVPNVDAYLRRIRFELPGIA